MSINCGHIFNSSFRKKDQYYLGGSLLPDTIDLSSLSDSGARF